MAAREEGGRSSRHEDEVKSLTAQISFLDCRYNSCTGSVVSRT